MGQLSVSHAFLLLPNYQALAWTPLLSSPQLVISLLALLLCGVLVQMSCPCHLLPYVFLLQETSHSSSYTSSLIVCVALFTSYFCSVYAM